MRALPPPAWRTAERRTLLRAVREEWLQAALRTAPADRAAAEAGVRMAYAQAGLPAPKAVVWLDSPWAGVLGVLHLALLGGGAGQGTPWAALEHAAEAGLVAHTESGSGDWAAPGRALWPQLRAQLPPPAGPLLGAADWDWTAGGGQAFTGPLTAAVEQALAWSGADGWRYVHDALEQWFAARGVPQLGRLSWRWAHRQLSRRLRPPVRTTALRLGNQALGNGHDAALFAPFDAVARVRGTPSALRGNMLVSRSAGPWWAFREAAVLTERPTRIARDAGGRPHAGDGPALTYPDGWEVYAWHGVLVPRRAVLAPQTLTAPEIIGEPDVEVRRVLVERFGPNRFLQLTGAEVLDADTQGTLYRVALPASDPVLLVRRRATALAPGGGHREYWLRVPLLTRTVHEARALTMEARWESPHDGAPPPP